MDIILARDYEGLSLSAANIVVQAIRRQSSLVLGLPTGSTPLGMYADLVRRHREEGLDFSAVRTFNLDEYVGLPADHPKSYHTYMKTRFFNLVNVPSENIHIPNGSSADLETECRNYEEAIRNAGGIDLLVAGVGRNGHIAFNEPGSTFDSRTRVVSLTQRTIAAASRHFDREEDVPRQAITMGIATLLDARRILLLVHGENKSEAMKAALEGPLTEQCPVSALRLHRDVTVISDVGSNWPSQSQITAQT